MTKRTTIELDQDLLDRAKLALGEASTRATVEEALRRAAGGAEADYARRAAKQRQYLAQLGSLADVTVLTSERMWR